MRRVLAVLVVVALVFPASFASADEITDWTHHMFQSAKDMAVSPLVITRHAAMVNAAMFDAVNGVNPVYESIHVAPDSVATDGASARAAAVQAAYLILTRLYPAEVGDLTVQRTASLAGIAESPAAIDKGVAWGNTVGEAIWTFCLTDGFSMVPPLYSGGDALGEWRSLTTPRTNGAGLQFPGMRPWVLNSASQFRPDGPPALESEQYARDFIETQRQTILAVSDVESDKAKNALFWNAGTASQLWNSVALALSESRGLTLSQNAQLFGRMSLAVADAAIVCWDAKYEYTFWRPMTAIAQADLDGNPLTVMDPAWTTTLFVTPNHPDYPSGHSCVSGAFGYILSRYFGEDTSFDVVTDRLVDMNGDPVKQHYSSFSEALEKVVEARVFSGIHFRTACEVGQKLGADVAQFVLTHAVAPLKGGKKLGHLLD
jgi:PAP2 superfamily